jgi:hypothetical protein
VNPAGIREKAINNTTTRSQRTNKSVFDEQKEISSARCGFASRLTTRAIPPPDMHRPQILAKLPKKGRKQRMMKHLPINPRRSPLTLLHPKRSFFAHSEYCQPSSGICLNTKPNELRHFLEVLLEVIPQNGASGLLKL